ncbi:class I SAM-dependent methyltransferase [Sinorhizobium meliloti]|nr:class I SAM-dependent methyltransferase [Sinorhizobium meliloti]
MNICPICSAASEFKEFRGRPAEQCPNCSSLERTRTVYLCLMMKGRLQQIGTASFDRSIHHFAPERSLYNELSAHGKNGQYRCYDFSPEIYKFANGRIKRHDLCDRDANRDLAMADIILHNHVLEHLPTDFRHVLDDLNSRLAPGGIHVFTLPTKGGKYDEDLSPNLAPEERKRRFAQEDHVRIFGRDDALEMIGEALGGNGSVFRLNHYLTPAMASVFGVRNSYDIDARGGVGGSTVFYYEKAAVGVEGATFPHGQSAMTKAGLAELLIELIDARLAETGGTGTSKRSSSEVARQTIDLLVDRIGSPDFYRNLEEAAE